jgi:hypothetical protein
MTCNEAAFPVLVQVVVPSLSLPMPLTPCAFISLTASLAKCLSPVSVWL